CPGQAGEATMSLGVGPRLDARGPQPAALLEDHALELQSGDGLAAVLVTDDALDRLAGRDGGLEPPGVVDNLAGPLEPAVQGRADFGAVAAHDIELGRRDRWLGDEDLGDLVRIDAGQAESAVGAGQGGRDRGPRPFHEALRGVVDAAVTRLVEPS